MHMLTYADDDTTFSDTKKAWNVEVSGCRIIRRLSESKLVYSPSQLLFILRFLVLEFPWQTCTLHAPFKEGHWVDLCNAVCNLNQKIKQLVWNIGIFAQKLKVFNGPLHFKGLVIMLGHMARAVFIGESLIKLWWLHTQRKDDSQHYFTVGFRFQYDLYTTRHERSQSDQKNTLLCLISSLPPNVCL